MDIGRVWLAWRGRRGSFVMVGPGGEPQVTELPGVPVLPFAGGYAEQPALLMDALEIMDQVEHLLPDADEF